MQAIEQHLKDLHTILRDPKSSSYFNPVQIISDINDFISKISSDEIGLCSSLIFDEQKGIFAFVDASLKIFREDKLMVHARKAAFDLVNNYIDQIDRRISEYALLIKRWCVNIFRREESNIVRQSTFGPLAKIIKFDFPFLDAEALQVSEMFDVYFKVYMRGKGAATGILSDRFPSTVHQKSKQLLHIYMNELKTQSTKHNPEPQLIAHTFKGLAYFLNQFGGSVEEGAKYLKPLYSYMCTALEKVNMNRHDIPKAGLFLLQKHAFQFKEYLTVDAEAMFDRMEKLCTHRNDLVRKAAFPALEAFISQVSFELVRDARDAESNIRTFKTLMTKFKNLMDQQHVGETNKYRLSMAIRCFGQFASAMRKYMGEGDTKLFLLKLFKLSDQLLTRSEEELQSSIGHLPSFISAYANIIIELEKIDSWIIDYLERIIGVLFLVYPKQFLFPKYRQANYSAMLKLFIALYIKENALEVLLSRIVFQGLTLTVSNSAAIGGEIETEIQGTSSMYEQYLELWSNLLDSKNIVLRKWNFPWTELQFGEDLQEHMHGLLYDKLVEAVMEMISKLDLRCTLINDEEGKKDEVVKEGEIQDSQEGRDFTPADVTSHIRPKNPKDFELYLNLVEFFQKLFPKCKPKHFLRWVYVFCKQSIERSNKYPYVSGFYKLLTCAMKICDENKYFEGISETTTLDGPKESDMDVEIEETEEKFGSLFTIDHRTKVTCFHILLKFCKDTIQRLHEFKGELLASCVKFILSMPTQFIDLKTFVTPLLISFEMGLSYLPLAKVGLDALEHWIKVLPMKDINDYLPQILPIMNEYLIVQSEEIEPDTITENIKKAKMRINKSSIDKIRSQQKLAAKLFSELDRTPLRKIQLRIIRLLGRIGGNNVFILNDKVAEKDMIAWDTTPRIQFPMPFRDTKPDIYFDSILPRVVELAEKSGDRKTKIAAGEFLHSVVLYMIGKNAYSPKIRQRMQDAKDGQKKSQASNEPTPFYMIYQKIFPTLLRLSVDTERVTKQLFEPLVFQLVHWFTQNIHYENKETMALLDAIIEGLTNPKDGALRDMCANLLNEFLRWSIKHDKNNKFVNAKSLFQRLYSNIHHPNLHKRLGAILAFNRMYRAIREVDELVDKHLLDILHNVIISLKIAHSDADSSTGLIERTVELLKHLEKIIAYKNKLLIEEKQRGYHPNLQHAVHWIFQQCGNFEVDCRQQCMKLFVALCMHLPDFNSEDGPRRWIQSNLKKEGETFLMNIAEKFSITDDLLKETQQSKKYRSVMQWLTELEASLDCYHWLFVQKLVAPHQVFKQKVEEDMEDIEEDSDKSKLFSHINLFLKHFALENNSTILSMTPYEEEKYNQKKCAVIQKLLKFIGLMAEKFSETLLSRPQQPLNKHLFMLLFTCMLIPQKVGFNTSDERVQTVLPRITKTLCKSLTEGIIQQKKGKLMNNVLKHMIQNNPLLDVFHYDLSNQTISLDDATFLCRGFRLLHILGLLQPNMTKDLTQSSTILGTSLFEYGKALTPVQTLIAKELWELCFDLNFPPETLINFLSDETPWGKDDFLSQKLSEVESNDSMEREEEKGERVKLSTKGEVFYKTFKDEIDNYIGKNFNLFSRALISKALKMKSYPFAILLNIGKKYERSKKDYQLFMQDVMKYSKALVKYTLNSTENQFEFQVNIMKLFDVMLGLNSQAFLNPEAKNFKYIVQMYVHCLRSKRDNKNPSLDLKLSGIKAIPHFLKLAKEYREIILDEVKQIVINEFPISFKELESNPTAYDDHLIIMEQLLFVLQISKSVELLQQLIPIFRWREHPLKEKMSRSLKSLFKDLSKDEIIRAANICLNTFFNEQLPLDVRRAVIQWVCLLCLEHMPHDAMTSFFEENIKMIANAVHKPTRFDYTLSNEDLKAVFVTRACCFNLLEAMYRLLPAATIKESINKKFCKATTNVTGKELTERVMRAAYEARCYKPEENEVEMIGYQLVLELHQAAYNTLASAVMCTQTQEKFYNGFLFREKSSDLWDNIVDIKQKHDFQVETNFEIHKKAVDKLRVATDQIKSSITTRTDKQLKYLSSQYLADSSLSADIPYIGSFFIPGSRYAEQNVETTNVDTFEPFSEKGPQETNKDVLEIDTFNANPCMITILRVIDYMTEKFKSTNDEMPAWMKELYNKIDDYSTPMNVKMFIAKIVINRPNLFEKFGKHWFIPLGLLIIADENGGNGINYFVRDLCLTLLNWKDLKPPNTIEGRKLATSIIEHLMKHCAHQKRIILKNNLELIKLLVEKWKNYIPISKNIILGWITYDEKHKSAKLCRTTGLQLLGVLLANDMKVYDEENDGAIISEERYFEKILDNLLFKSKDVYEAASEVCGMILNQLSAQTDATSFDLFNQLLVARLAMFMSRGEYDRFLLCLNKIAIHNTQFLDNFLPTKIIEILPNLYGIYKRIALQLMNWRAENISNLFKSFQPYVQPFLQHREEDTQLLTLQIIHKCLRSMEKKDIMFVIDFMSKLHENSEVFHSTFSEVCRSMYYDILIWLYDNKEGFASEEAVRLSLLRGMNDESEEVRKKLLDFWDHESRLSIESMKRLEQMFAILYSENLGENWLKYASHLLLQLIHKSPDFADSKAIFHEGLSNCEFKEYHIDVSWQSRSLPMTPLFSQSQTATQLSLGDPDAMEVDFPDQVGYVRATQTPQFTLTQFGPSLTMRSVLSDPSLTQTSLLFTPFKKLKSQDGQESKSSQFEQSRLRRRFFKTSETSLTAHHIQRAVRLKREREAWEARQKIARKNKVNLYRKYRTGELPDIQIPMKEFIVPLQALCLADVNVAKNLCLDLFNTLYPQIVKKMEENEAKQVKQKIHQIIPKMMTSSRDSAPLIAFLLNICLEHEDLLTLLPAKMIREASLQSYNMVMAILLLEKKIIFSKKLIKKEEDEEMEDESNKITQSGDIDTWIELAQLYNSIDEEDVVKSIFEYHVAQHNYTKQGLHYELENDLAAASKIYMQAIKEFKDGWKHGERPSLQEVEFWKNESLNCLLRLNKWDELYDNIEKEICGEGDVKRSIHNIWKYENADTLLAYYIESAIKQSDKWSDLQSFIEKSMSIPERRFILEKKFSRDLATLSLINKQNEKARSYIMDAYGEFIANWSSLSPLATTGRHRNLQKLQQLVEMEEYIKFINRKDFVKGFEVILNSWKRRYPNFKLDGTHVWDNILKNRSLLFDRIVEHMSTLLIKKKENVSDEEAVQPLIELSQVTKTVFEQKARMYLIAAKAARKQGNYNVAQGFLKDAQEVRKKLVNQSSGGIFDFSFFESLVKLLLVKAKKKNDEKETFNLLEKIMKYIKQNQEEVVKNEGNKIVYTMLYADTLVDAIQKMDQFNISTSKLGSKSDLISKAYKFHNKAAEIALKVNDKHQLPKTLMKFGSFCDELLRRDDCEIDETELANHVIINYLNAMKHSHAEARARFPRLLELIERFPDSQNTFIQQVKDIPSWMFLRWISQILPHLNGNHGKCLLDLLNKIAEEYPQALYYPLNISKEDIKPKDVEVKRGIKLLETKLRNPKLELFILALEKMTHPEMRWKTHSDEIKALLKKGDKNQVLEYWRQCFDDMFDPNQPHIGAYNKRFAQNWAPIIKKELGGREGTKLLQMDAKTFEKYANSKAKKMKETRGAMTPGPGKLAHFSTYLADFYQSNEDGLHYIELPGQYNVDYRPDPNSIVKIASFDPNILIMGSIRRPKRLIIHGNDEKEYKFLVKGGEDLRQDQRIQQLFSVMNDILKQDPNCCKRKLTVKTYKVIPMSKNVGIIEWVDNTMPLKAIIEKELAKRMKVAKVDILKHQAAQQHMELLQRCRSSSASALHQLYMRMFQKISREQVTEMMERQWNLIPEDLLKCGILSLSSNAEAFFTLRNRFAKSLSVLNTCSYILGIGDRHLENFLLDYSDGFVVGIDFGHAFGSATEILPVPELIPFRLTRQFTHVTDPMISEGGRVDGIIGHSMIHTLSALADAKDLLLNTMDIFIKEPLVDWLKFAKTNAAKMKLTPEEESSSLASDISTEGENWYPQKKIILAKRKLEKWNPVYITLEDLNGNRHTKPALKYIQRVLKGDAKINKRAQVGEICESVREQVECLIDIATDTNILGRTYVGWSSWV